MTELPPNRAYLSFGSNVEPEKNLPNALRLVSYVGRVAAVSSVWGSHAERGSGDPRVLNAAVLLQTPLTAAELSQSIRDFEEYLGRHRTADHSAPSTIEIEIMLFNRDVLTLENRTIPDGGIYTHPFIAIPLAEIDPGYLHPVTGETLAEIAGRFDPEKTEMRRVIIPVSPTH
jgi:2-amino-4-hydroxy-6-hydroxymethyldihydropteridine diphosphokinase